MKDIKLTPIELKEYRQATERAFQEIVVWERVRKMDKPINEDEMKLSLVRDELRRIQDGAR